MELYYTCSEAEEALCAKAERALIPIGGTMELLPLCNMDCRMCYIRQTKTEMDAEGRMLSCEEWLRIADEGMREGLLFVLLTGGEPLLYPEFRQLYAGLRKRGLIVSINTNATLIDEEWGDFLAEHGCRRLSISLYGADDETYGALCGNPHGFSQVMRAAVILKERGIPFRFTCSVTPKNAGQIHRIYAIAHEIGVPVSMATYMYPAARRGKNADEQYRLSPDEQAKATLNVYRMQHPALSMKEIAQAAIDELRKPPFLKGVRQGFSCRAGKSGFWINWKGEMLACGMFSDPRISLLEHSFQACWSHTIKMAQSLPQSKACVNCVLQNVCRPCAAMCYTETGSTDGRPGYLCKCTSELLKACLQEMDE